MFDDITSWLTRKEALLALELLFVYLLFKIGRFQTLLSQKLDDIDIALGRLRVRVENLEGTVYGAKRAKEKYEYSMGLESNPAYRGDPDAIEARISMTRHRDGFDEPNFGAWFGDDGVYGRILNIEKELGIKHHDDDDINDDEENIAEMGPRPMFITDFVNNFLHKKYADATPEEKKSALEAYKKYRAEFNANKQQEE